MKIGDEELRLISTFIGPAILAAVVSGVFSILLSRNSARLEYIINERSKWRERIREICQGIQSHNLKEISGSLQRLKLYINAYGIPHNTKEDLNLKAGHILMDTHIWALIISIEIDIQYLSECDEKNSITAIKFDGSNRVKDRNRYKLDADRCKRMKMIDEKCNLLQNYISLLLKNDWEKARM